MMSSHRPNLVAIGRKERLLRHIRFRYPGGYRFARPDRNGLIALILIQNPYTPCTQRKMFIFFVCLLEEPITVGKRITEAGYETEKKKLKTLFILEDLELIRLLA